jgi:hypothetical protein
VSDWNIIVLSLFSATYLPLFWFVGMRIASEDILRKSKFYEADPNVLVPGWAKTCTTVFCVLHYCLFIIPLTMIDWLHGLAAFGAGILLLVFLPLFRKSYMPVFKARCARSQERPFNRSIINSCVEGLDFWLKMLCLAFIHIT